MSLQSPWLSLLALALMLAAVFCGGAIRKRWPEHHTNRETIELLQTTVMLLATFAAIVLGLLITSAKADFDDLQNDIRSFSATLVQLDYGLAEIGPETAPIRQSLVRYVATATASVWRDQAPPPGNYYAIIPPSHTPGLSTAAPVLGQMLERTNTALQGLAPQGPGGVQRLAAVRRLMDVAINERWRIIEASQGTLSSPFFSVLLFWTVVIYLCFGLSAPLNRVNLMALTLSAMALSSALFVIIDLYTPFSGLFTVSSMPMREAITEMLKEPDSLPPPRPANCRPDAPSC
ncbi:bestrophin-like domain [Acidisoma sp. 7E03]